MIKEQSENFLDFEIIHYSDIIFSEPAMTWSEYFNKIYNNMLITFVIIYIYFYYYSRLNSVSPHDE